MNNDNFNSVNDAIKRNEELAKQIQERQKHEELERMKTQQQQEELNKTLFMVYLLNKFSDK